MNILLHRGYINMHIADRIVVIFHSKIINMNKILFVLILLRFNTERKLNF